MAYYVVPEFEGKQEGNRIVWEAAGEVAYLEPYGESAIRFRSSKSLHIDEALNWTLLEVSPAKDVKITLTKERGILVNGKITAEITGDGTVTYRNTKTGKVLLEEYWIDGRVNTAPLRKAREFKTNSGDSFKIDLYFKPDPQEHFFGMGQDANDCFDLKGSTVELFQKNGKCTIPYCYSTKGYGFLWNNPAVGQTEFVANHTRWHAESARQLDYIVISEDTPAKINFLFTQITGRSSVIPQWATGFWQCKLRYETQEELMEVAREYKRRGLPISVIVIDYFHWTQQGEWKFDPVNWPDPAGMVKELTEMGIKLMVSIWPTVDLRSENYATMHKQNFLVRAEKSLDAFMNFYGPQTYFDATHPGAQRFVWERAKENYYRYGIKTFWLDEAEPEMRPYDFDNIRMYLGNGNEVSNIYCDGFAKAFYDGMRAEGETEICNLIRCAWLGTQRYDVILWSGDIASTFDSFRKQIKAGLNVSYCGIPWWTTDIGGFIGGDPSDPVFRQLIVRWFQYGVFCPVFRLHGFRLPYPERKVLSPNGKSHSGGPNEVWSYGEEAYTILCEYLQLRERLRPYVMEQMRTAAKDGTPVMRTLHYDFPQDPAAVLVSDEYMFGPDLLVAPVITQDTDAREVYFPVGASWRDARTKKTYPGGTTHKVDAPLSCIPVFYRDEADLMLY